MVGVEEDKRLSFVGGFVVLDGVMVWVDSLLLGVSVYCDSDLPFVMMILL